MQKRKLGKNCIVIININSLYFTRRSHGRRGFLGNVA
jgi:hypothetical protein